MSFNFSALVDSISAAAPEAESTYVAEDGLLHCSVCHRAVQVRVEFAGIEKIVRCVCDCKKREFEAEEERKRQDEADRKRRICFAETEMWKWTFTNDDRKNEKLSDAMKRYAENFKDFRKDGKGLLLYGTVGTGKTFYAACIANALIDRGYPVLMTNFASLTNKIQGMYEGKQKFIDSLNDYTLLIIDDLGVERKSEFMQEMVFNIIDSRYRSGLPFIITTNLSADEIKNAKEISFQRIYDRILERCFPIEVSGVSRRKTSLKESYAETKAMLGL